MNLNSSLQKTPIAVIGLSAMFADARNLEEFWTNIILAKDSIKDVPANRWLIEDYYDPDMTAPDKTYCKRGGFLPEIDFNPLEFGLPPNILEVTDASQLLALVAARDAFADAGYGKGSEKFSKELKAKTGVLLGVGGGQKLITPLISRLQYPIWERALRASGIAEEDIPPIVEKMKKAYVSWNENAFPGLLGNVISGRITNRFDLGGINSVVDAACAASLSAIKMALSELVEGRCDMMLTGGVDTDNSPFMYMSFSKTPAFSKSGNISPYSDKADGMLIGEGVGMLVLKRLEDAERDGDHIYSLITGVGTSSDGRFKSVYAPRSSGQALAMTRAYEDAGYSPATVGLLEGHGTGTGAGDPTELNSMQMAFGEQIPKKQHIALGSVKSQIGHTKAAAGAAGIIKTVLALHHKVLPPTINVEAPNSKFDIKNSALYLNTETRPWMRNGHPRRAGVSAFGFGGINVHIALEEYTGQHKVNGRLHQPFKAVLLQAATPTELLKLCQHKIEELEGAEATKAFSKLVAESKNLKLNPSAPRVGFVAKDIEECVDFLNVASTQLAKNTTAWTHPKGIYYRPAGIDTASNKVVALFAGQGAQYIGMGKEMANAFPEVASAFEQADNLFKQNGATSLTEKIFPIPVFSKEEKDAQQVELTKTQFAQPAIGAFSIGQYKALQNAGFRPHFTAGHSFGELTALWAAGVYNDYTFLDLAKARGEAMARRNPGADAGTMLAVKAPVETVKEAIKHISGVQIANVNSNNQVVLGGSTAAIQWATKQLSAQGFTVIPLPVAAAFHTPFVEHAQQPFSVFIANQSFNAPQIPVYANTTGKPYPHNTALLKSILKDQILNPVLFKDQIENIYKDGGRVFVEFGPKGILTKLVSNILKDKPHFAIAVNGSAKNDSDLQFRQAVVQLQVLGLSLGNIDPYKKALVPDAPLTKLNVKLSGNNYVSKPTQKAYEQSLNDGFTISGGTPQIIEKEVEKVIEKVVEKEVEKVVTVEKIVEVPVYDSGINIQNENEEDMNKEVLQLLQSTIELFKSNQTKSLEIFERFMKEQNQQSQQLLQLLALQLNPTQQNQAIENKPERNTLEAPVSKPVELPSYTNGTNGANGYNGTNGYTTTTAPVTEKETAPVTFVQENISPKVIEEEVTSNNAVEAVTPTHATGVDLSKLTAGLLEVVSEKTGYPAEMLELNMDMEADLGIDSIKRVEIFGSLTQQYPEISGINPNELTELRTLQEVVDYVGAKATSSGSTDAASASAPVAVSEPTPVTPVAAPAASGFDKDKLTAALLEVVSEKTGYPAEMLELSMDMEADLGIDSIKRVEIFGSLTQQYPEVSNINPNELTELRTLQEVVDYVSGKGGISTATTTATPVQSAASVAVVDNSSENASGLDFKVLTAGLLDVVSEKTGYPAEMLELNMDMEADLGIDSIKRVEIFGTLTQKFPELSGINPNELTELRTLQEIVNYVGANGKKKALV